MRRVRKVASPLLLSGFPLSAKGKAAAETRDGQAGFERLSVEVSLVLKNYYLVSRSLTLAITTIPTKVTATCVLELAFALGTDANHCRHDCACYAR